MLIDEIHTPDSSRYFIANGYESRQAEGTQQKQLSKEFVREWLMENGFMGLENQAIPHIPDDFVQTVSERYISLYEQVTGMNFQGDNAVDPIAAVQTAVEHWLTDNR